jgi:hypothetical protein
MPPPAHAIDGNHTANHFILKQSRRRRVLDLLKHAIFAFFSLEPPPPMWAH